MTRHSADDLRAMLRRRADDITEVPERVFPVAEDVLSHDGDRSHDGVPGSTPTEPRSINGADLAEAAPARWRSAPWLVAAAAVAVLVIAGGIVGVHEITSQQPAANQADAVGAADNDAPAGRGQESAARPSGATARASGSHAAPDARPTPAGDAAASEYSAGGAASAPVDNESTSGDQAASVGGPAHFAPQTCTAPLSAAWTSALGATGTAFGAQSAQPLSITDGGDVLVARDFGHGDKRDLVLVDPSAPTTVAQVLFTVAKPETLGIENAYLHGQWLVVSVGAMPRPPKGEKPGSSPMPNVVHLYVIDTENGERTEIASGSVPSASSQEKHAPTITSAVVLDGTVYWDTEVSYSAQSATIHSYDLATGARSETSTPLAHFYASSNVSAAGISVFGEVIVPAPAPLPDRITRARAQNPQARAAHIQSDGNAYAWIAGPQVLGWWTPGLDSPTYVRLDKPLPSSHYTDVLAVAGKYVIVDYSRIVDMTTGAVATLEMSPTHEPITLAGGDTAVSFSMVGNGHWQGGYWIDPQQQVSIVDLSGLPELTC